MQHRAEDRIVVHRGKQQLPAARDSGAEPGSGSQEQAAAKMATGHPAGQALIVCAASAIEGTSTTTTPSCPASCAATAAPARHPRLAAPVPQARHDHADRFGLVRTQPRPRLLAGRLSTTASRR
jgi:hypothetical protein